MPDTKTHYVAQLKIEKVEKSAPRVSTTDRGQVPARVIDEVTQITIKADNLQSLVDKLGKHVDIITED